MSDTSDQINLWVNAAKAVADLQAAEVDINNHGIASRNPQRDRFGEMTIRRIEAQRALDKALAATGTIPPEDIRSDTARKIVEEGLREHVARIKPETATTLRRQGFSVQQAQTAAPTDPSKPNGQRQTTLKVIHGEGNPPDIPKYLAFGQTLAVHPNRLNQNQIADRIPLSLPQQSPSGSYISPSGATPQAMPPESSLTPPSVPSNAIHTVPIGILPSQNTNPQQALDPSANSPIPIEPEQSNPRGNDFRPAPPKTRGIPIVLVDTQQQVSAATPPKPSSPPTISKSISTTPESPIKLESFTVRQRAIAPAEGIPIFRDVDTTPAQPTPSSTTSAESPKPKQATVPILKSPIARSGVGAAGIAAVDLVTRGTIDGTTAKKAAMQSAPAALQTLGKVVDKGSKALVQTAPKLAQALGTAAPVLEKGAQLAGKAAMPIQIVTTAAPGAIQGVEEIRAGNTEQGLKTLRHTATTTTFAVSGGYVGAKAGVAIMTPVAGKVCIPVAIATTPVGGGICGTVLIGGGGIIGAFGGSWLGAKLANWLNKPAEKPNSNNMMNGITGYQGNSFAFK